MNKRDKAIVIGYDFSEWVGEMAIAYSPAMFSVGMAMVAVSIALRGAIATNVIFDVAWAIVTAVCVDGLWLGVWLRLSDSRITDWASGLRYMATLFVALLMFVVGAAMSILVTFQQVNGVSDELIAMNTLQDRKSTRLNSSHTVISYAVFCLKKKNRTIDTRQTRISCDEAELSKQDRTTQHTGTECSSKIYTRNMWSN